MVLLPSLTARSRTLGESLFDFLTDESLRVLSLLKTWRKSNRPVPRPFCVTSSRSRGLIVAQVSQFHGTIRQLVEYLSCHL